MRLIDVDAMNEELFYKELGGRDSLISAESVFDMLRATPTAYDVEKVVAELEERKGTYFDGERCEGTMIKINEAIEIVRKGGAE